MHWYQQLIAGTSVAGILTGFSVAAAIGLALGGIKVKGFSLGIAGVLFTGILFSDLCWNHALLARFASSAGGTAIAGLEEIRRRELEFMRDLGLVLSVYSIGLQVGPGFFSSLRAQGLRWNMVTIALVALDVIMVVVARGWLRIDPVAAVGLLSGAVTNTPGLAAAEQALRDLPSVSAAHRDLAAVGCAVAYPFGVVGAIVSLVVFRALFRLDPRREAERFGRTTHRRRPLGNIHLRVVNPAVAGQRVGQLAGLLRAPVVVSRMMRAGQVDLPSAETRLEMGDLLHAVGSDEDLERLAVLLGERSDVDLREVSRNLDVRRVVITRSGVVGKTLETLGLRARYGVNVTRVLRAGLELVPDASVHLNFGDTLVVVGEDPRLAEVEALVGNSVGELEHGQLVPVFVGIACGILVGSIPISVGGLPAPVRLGMAGGPLLVALVFSHLGRLGRFTFYLPNSANLMLRDLGIVLFLGSVGLLSGERFVQAVSHGEGLRWLLLGASITLVPLLVTQVLARVWLGMDYTAVSGVVAGSMTSPPVLAFATQLAGDGAAVAYGVVYPLAMILRVVTAQLLVVFWVASP